MFYCKMYEKSHESQSLILLKIIFILGHFFHELVTGDWRGDSLATIVQWSINGIFSPSIITAIDIWIFGYQTPPAVGFLCGNWWIEWPGGNICRGPHTCQHFTIYSCAFSSDGTNILLFDGTRANILRISLQGGGNIVILCYPAPPGVKREMTVLISFPCLCIKPSFINHFKSKFSSTHFQVSITFCKENRL